MVNHSEYCYHRIRSDKIMRISIEGQSKDAVIVPLLIPNDEERLKAVFIPMSWFNNEDNLTLQV